MTSWSWEVINTSLQQGVAPADLNRIAMFLFLERHSLNVTDNYCIVMRFGKQWKKDRYKLSRQKHELVDILFHKWLFNPGRKKLGKKLLK